MNKKYFKCSTAILGILAGMTISTSIIHADTSADSHLGAAINVTTSNTTNSSVQEKVNNPLTEDQSQNNENVNKVSEPSSNVKSSFVYNANIKNSGNSELTATASTVTRNASAYNGWEQTEDGSWTYYQNGQLVSDGWQWINGNWYYFENGIMSQNQIIPTTNTHTVNWAGFGSVEYPICYYADQNGHLYKNSWIYDHGYWHYAKSDGVLAGPEWLNINGSWYFFYAGKGNPVLATNQAVADIHGNVYYFDENGHYLTNQWVWTDNDYGEGWGYASANGILYGNGWHWINGNWFYFSGGVAASADRDSEPALMQTGWQKINGSWYYLQPGSGHMLTGWQWINGSWYYLQPGSGHMLTGWQWINGHWYFFNNGGDAATGWQKINGSWYYFDPANTWMLTGWQNINGKNYYFTPSGSWNGHSSNNQANTSGKWIHPYEGSSDWQFIKPNGRIAKDEWVTSNGKKYYLDEFGRMATNGWYITYPTHQDSLTDRHFVKYHFDENGQVEHNQWIRPYDGSSDWQYAKADGKEAKDEWLTINGKKYYFDEFGNMAANGKYTTYPTYQDSLTGLNAVDYYFDENGQVIR